jgi:tetratricopeptide (TPR) repeat protein
MEQRPRTEPVAALAARAELSLPDRLWRLVERAIEAFLVDDQNGVYGVRRVGSIVRKGNFERALSVIRALYEEHDLAPVPYAWAAAFEGWCLLALGDVPGAAAAARKVRLEDLPKRAHNIVFSVLSTDARLRSDYASMLRFAHALHDVAPSLETEFQIAIAEKNLGELDAAIARLDSVAQRAPKNAIIAVARAGYCVLRGDDGAREHVERVLNDATMERGDPLWWHANRMWIFGVLDDITAATHALRELVAATPETQKAAMVIYIESEADLRKFIHRPPFSDVFEKWRRE